MARRRSRSSTPGPWSARVLIAPGLEEALQGELRDLGIEATIAKGAVEARLTAEQLHLLHHASRLAARVTLKLGTVGAESLEQLADRVRKLPWSLYVHPRQGLDVHASSVQSRLRHRDRIAAKVEVAIRDALRGPRRPGGRPPRHPARIGVRLDKDKATLQVDASGELLHKRGWRRDVGRAPIRENLACAVLRVAGWQPGEALVDPMCGAGTFPVEAALWTLGRDLGQGRRFAYQDWPCWSDRPAPSLRTPRDTGALILGFDRDPDALPRCLANARRARVDARLRIETVALEHLQPPVERGLVVLNPPWGERLGSPAQLGRIHAGWSRHLREGWPGWRVAAVVPDAGWARSAWGGRVAARFKSGGVRVAVLVRDAGAAD